MERANFTHYRDHKNGGKFDGNCYAIDSGFTVTDPKHPIDVRIYIEGIDGDQYLFCIGSTVNLEYYVKLIDNTDYYTPVVYYLNQIYTFSNIRIYPLRYYNLSIKQLTATHFTIEQREQYDKLINTQSVFALTASGTLGTGLRVGGHPRFTSNNYIGFIYDFHTYYSSSSHTRFVFYENYNNGGGAASSDTIANYYSTKNDLTITSRPSDFWADSHVINNYFSQNKGIKINILTDKFHDLTFSKFEFQLFFYPYSIKKGDIIAVEIGDANIGFFIIDTVSIFDDNYIDVVAYEFWYFLKDFVNTRIWQYNSSADAFTYSYWSNYYPASSEYYLTSPIDYTNFYSLKFVLNQLFYVLQMDNIITSGITIPSTSDSSYYAYGLSRYIKYNEIIFNWNMLFAFNRDCSIGYGEIPRVDELFRYILSALRFKFSYYTDEILFTNDDTAKFTITTDNYDYLKKNINELQDKYPQISINILKDSTGSTIYPKPDITRYDNNYISTDLEEMIGQKEWLTTFDWQEKRKMQNKVGHHFWLFCRDGSTSTTILYFYNANEEENFVNQWSSILSDELLKTFIYNIRVQENECLYTNIGQKFNYVKYDFAKRLMEIKQEE